ncbi:MAG TPA: fibronectin type III domain-containing protein [Nocardioidaceae bacterium]|nr:fibronectin type III domain-containing protein [Nocardioidaceae bacterium]
MDTAFLPGRVSDDGLPDPSALALSWSKVSGPGTVTFGRSDESLTTAEFSAAGAYVLRLTASDGGGTGFDEVTVNVRSSHSVTVRVPADYPTIQAALDAAPTNALVLVSPGTYKEALYVPRTLTLASTFYTSRDRSMIDQTVISNPSPDSETVVVSSASGPDTRVVGFSVRDGKDGIKVRGAAVVEHNLLTNLATDAVDFPRDRTGLAQHNIMEDNGDDAVDVNESSVLILDNVMRNNAGDGVEIRVTNMVAPVDEVIIRGNDIRDNTQDGVQIIDDDEITASAAGSATVFTIDRNVIAGNVQAGLGLMDVGKTSEDYRGASLVERVTVTNNTFDGNNHGIAGGDNLVAVNNVFARHTNYALKNVDANSATGYNQFHANGADYVNSNLAAATSFSGDPMLDTSFAPTSGSPVIDAGTAAYTLASGERAVTVSDFGGTAPDIGAVESGMVRTNRAPSVSAGPDTEITLPASATLAGTAADDGLPTNTLDITWQKAAGPGTVTFTTPNAASASATFSVAGTYELRLTADDGALSSSDTVLVTVNAATSTPTNAAPTVNAGPDQAVTLPSTAALDGTADDDGLPTGTLSTTWSTVSGPGPVDFADETAEDTSATFSTAGSYVLRLTATDGALSTIDTVTVTVSATPTGGGDTGGSTGGGDTGGSTGGGGGGAPAPAPAPAPTDPEPTEAVAGPPDMPSDVLATYGNASAQITWTAPRDNGSPITGYVVTASPGGSKVAVGGDTTTATVTGLTNGVPYTFTVVATNAVGTSLVSATSNRVTPATTPGRVRRPRLLVLGKRVVVSWAAPSNGGSAINRYRVTNGKGKVIVVPGSARRVVFRGLAPARYAFRVVAVNRVGRSPRSLPTVVRIKRPV